MSDSLWPHESQHARPSCASPTPGVHPDSRPSSQWCHPAISYSVIPFSSCPQSLPASESFPMSQLFAWGGQSTWTRVILCIMSIKFISLWTVLWQRMKSLLWSWVRMVDTYCCLPHASEKCFWFFFLIEMGRNAFPRSVVKYHDLKLYQSALVKILQPATHCDWCYYLVEYLAVHSHLPSSIWLLCLPD